MKFSVKCVHCNAEIKGIARITSNFHTHMTLIKFSFNHAKSLQLAYLGNNILIVVRQYTITETIFDRSHGASSRWNSYPV